MKTMIQNHITMEMTRETDINHPEIQWWANHLLEMGSRCDYNGLMHWLEIAKNVGSLTAIRQAADRIVRLRKVKKLKPLRKTTVAYKAVA